MLNNWKHWLKISLGLITFCLPLWAVAQPAALFTQVNSGYDEQFPVLSPDGQLLYFVRNQHPNNIGFDNLPDIWQSQRKADGTWGACIHLGLPINDLKSNLLVGLNTDGSTLYLAETDGYQSWINITHRKGRRWAPSQSMIIDRFIPGATASFSVSPNEQFLLLASQQSEGLGSMDLYVSFRSGERRWSHPVHLGSSLNTPGKEAWGMIAADGQTLYFTSNGHPGGVGGLDLWMSRRIDASWQKWSTPINLGPSINSPGDEISLAISGEENMAVLARMTDQNQYDLQQINLAEETRPFPIAILSGQLLEEQTELPQTGEIYYRFLDVEDAKEQRLRLQEDGTYKVIVPLNRGIAFSGNLPGYLPLSERFDKFPLAEKLDISNAQIAAWAGMNAFYWQEEKAIHHLQNQLQLILNKKETLEKEKKIHRQLLAEKTYDELENESVIPPNPEIEALERRFNIYYRHRSDTLSLLGHQQKKLLPDQPRGTSTGESKREYEKSLDEETLKLNEQFRAHRSSTNSNLSTLLEEGGVIKEQLPFSFQDLKQRAEKEITYTMLPRVQAGLVQELFPQAWRAIQQNISTSVFKSLTEREDSIRIQTRQDLGQFILASDPFLVNSTAEDYKWWQQLKTDLKNVLRQYIRTQLEQNLRPYVLKAIQLELDYQVAQLVEENQRKDLNSKIEQQQKIEMTSEDVGLYLDQVPKNLPEDISLGTTNTLIHQGKDLLLNPIEEGRILELKNVHFTPDGVILTPDSFIELDSILYFLKHNQDIRIEIRTHTHGWCDHKKANNLTFARARLLRNHFILRGISSERIRYSGLGKTYPRQDNKTLEGRAANQRIELKILSLSNEN